MPRKETLTVADFPPIRPGRRYPVLVFHIERKGHPFGLAVRLRHLDPDQDGREEVVELTLPVRPSGRTASFFAACGEQIAAGRKIAIAEAIGKVIYVTFGSLHGAMTIDTLESKETDHGPDAEQSVACR